jgi:hypothetical protein
MTREQKQAHMRMMQTQPVRTHYKKEPQVELNPYSGRPMATEAMRRSLADRMLAKSKMPAWSKKNFEVVDGKVVA